MNRDCFTTVAKDVLCLKPEAGLTVKYHKHDAEVSLSTTTTLEQPRFAGKFKLTPGTIEISTPVKEGPVNLKVCPDLSKFDATLAVYPLKAGEFEFGIKKACPTGSTVELKYGAKDQTLTAIVRPKAVAGPALLSGEIVAKTPKELVHAKACAEIKDATLRCHYEHAAKQLRTAAFYKFPKAGPICCSVFGLGAAFAAPAAPEELFVMAKACVKGKLIVSSIVDILKASQVDPKVEFRALYKDSCPKTDYQFGLKAVCNKGGLCELVQGFSAGCKAGGKIAYSINNNRRLVTQFTFPPCKFFDAKGTVTATFEKLEAKKESLIPQLGVTICIGE